MRMCNVKTKTAVLIPCYNEEVTIKKVITDFQKTMPWAEIYVYDNNSTDRTAEIALECGANLRFEYKQGKGNVVRSMFRDIEADCYILVDGDDTYPAEDALRLENAVLSGKADMAIGDRLSSTYFEENKRAFHNFGNVLVKKLINFIYKSDVHDIMTGLRAFSYDFVKSFPVMSKGFEIETEMTVFALDNNFKLYETPIDYRDRPSGSESKLNTVKDGTKVLKTIVSLFKNTKPFIFFSMLSAIFMIIALVLFIPVFIEYLKTGLVPRIPTLIVSIGMMMFSFLTLNSGITLSVLKRQERQQVERHLTTVKMINNIRGDNNE